MGLSKDMKNLSEEIVSSYEQRIKENAELVSEVQQTLEGFRRDHQEMATILKSNAAVLRIKLGSDEKERLQTYKKLMAGIHDTVSSIQNEVNNLLNGNEKRRFKEFDALMKGIRKKVLDISTYTNDLLTKFGKEHLEMSAELRSELSTNLAERVEYTKSMLRKFQEKLLKINQENQEMSQKLRKDLSDGEAERLNDYNELMKEIHSEIKNIKKDVAQLLNDFLQVEDKPQNTMPDNLAKLKNTVAETANGGIRKTKNKKKQIIHT